MKVKLQTIFPRKTIEVDGVFFSSDLHLNHESIISFGRDFENVEQMNSSIIKEINERVRENSLLVLLGDTMMGEKDYGEFLRNIRCKYVIILYGNHCNIGKLQKVYEESDKLLYVGHYLELSIDRQWICCSHYPAFNWNYQAEASYYLHGHLHADKGEIVRMIHEYKSMDVGIDNYYKLFNKYSIFSFLEICELMKGKKVTDRH